MEDRDIQQLIQREIATAQNDALYSTKNAAAHTHNGIDSPLLSTLITSSIINVASSTSPTLTVAQSGSVVVMNSTTGSLVTLPVPTAGLIYEFIVQTAATTGSHGIITKATTASFIGSITQSTSSTGTVATFSGGSTLSAIHMNGTTTGGSPGTYIRVMGLNSTQWLVNGYSLGSGVISTPFFGR